MGISAILNVINEFFAGLYEIVGVLGAFLVVDGGVVEESNFDGFLKLFGLAVLEGLVGDFNNFNSVLDEANNVA